MTDRQGPESDAPEGIEGDSDGDARTPRRLRPWYLVVAMCITWVIGVFGATSGCSELGYLRGSQDMPDEISRGVEEADHPIWRMELVRQRARLEALADLHERAFPLGAAQLLLSILLVIVSGSALAGRRGARSLAIQAITANVALSILTFALLEPVRERSAQAVAEDAVEHGPGLLSGMNEDQSIASYRQQQIDNERFRLGLEVLVFSLAALALTRRRTKDYFAAVAASLPDPDSAEP